MTKNIIAELFIGIFGAKGFTSVIGEAPIYPQWRGMDADWETGIAKYVCEHELYGYSPELGFKKINLYMGYDDTCGKNNNKRSDGSPLWIADNVETFKYFIVKRNTYFKELSTVYEEKVVFVYDAPDFAAFRITYFNDWLHRLCKVAC